MHAHLNVKINKTKLRIAHFMYFLLLNLIESMALQLLNSPPRTPKIVNMVPED